RRERHQQRQKAWAWARARSCGGLLHGTEIVERVGEMPANNAGLLRGEHPVTVCLEPLCACADGRGRGVECPAEMLAGMAPPDRAAVVGEHLVVERSDQRELRCERWLALAPA